MRGQAIDLLQPLATSAPLMQVHRALRARVPTLEHDRPPSPDIAAIAALIATASSNARARAKSTETFSSNSIDNDRARAISF